MPKQFHPVYPHIEITEEEVWVDTPRRGYQVSSWGRVRNAGFSIIQHSHRNGKKMRFVRSFKPRLMKRSRTPTGYVQACTGRGGIRNIHTLVLLSFIGPCPEGMECRHLNDNKADNRLENLAWGTRQENIADRLRNGIAGRQYGEGSPHAILTKEQVLVIRARYARGGVSQYALAREYGVHQITISQIITRKTWKQI